LHRAAALDWACLLVLVIIWGSAFAGVRIGVETIDPMWLVTGRLLFGAAFLAIWMLAVGLARRHDAAHNVISWRSVTVISWRSVAWLSLVGVAFTALPYLCYAIAARSVPSAALAICNGGTPIFTALLAHHFSEGDRLTPRRTLGVALCFAGLAVLVGPAAIDGASASVSGLALAIFGAVLYACGNVATRRAPSVTPVTASLIITVSGGLAMLPAALAFAPVPAAPSMASLTAMILLAMLPTAFAMILYVWLIHRAGPVFVSFSTYLSPVWAAGVGVLFLDEALRWPMAGALALILAGVVVANRRPNGQGAEQAD